MFWKPQSTLDRLFVLSWQAYGRNSCLILEASGHFRLEHLILVAHEGWITLHQTTRFQWDFGWTCSIELSYHSHVDTAGYPAKQAQVMEYEELHHTSKPQIIHLSIPMSLSDPASYHVYSLTISCFPTKRSKLLPLACLIYRSSL
jgi:hypothetical protein